MAALAVVIIGITFFSLVFGELVPKSIAMQHPERVAMLVARPLKRLSRVMKPFVAALAYRFEVLDMDRNRIDRVLVSPA